MKQETYTLQEKREVIAEWLTNSVRRLKTFRGREEALHFYDLASEANMLNHWWPDMAAIIENLLQEDDEEELPPPHCDDDGPELPPQLSTPRAMAVWQLLQENELVDEYLQPSPTLSRAKVAILADYMGRHLGLKSRWKPFEQAWGRRYMSSDYQKAVSQSGQGYFIDSVKQVLAQDRG